MESLVVNDGTNSVTYWLPANIEDVFFLVNESIAKSEIICLRGSAHSFPLIKTLEKNANGRAYKYIMLSKMNKVDIDTKNSTVKVAAGCHLGFDPWDPTFTSTINNSLLFQLDQVKLAIPDLGGITHQTVGGFLSTGSSGGSTKYSFEDCLIGVEIVTSEGEVATLQSFTRPANEDLDDPFFAVGVASMGLFGVMVSATFKCVPNFYIAGQEATTVYSDCEIDLFADGTQDKKSLQSFLTDSDYTRLMWWPQINVGKMVVWKAWQASLADAQNWAGIKQTGTDPVLKPYQEVPYILNSPLPATIAADLLFTSIGQWPDWIDNILANDPNTLLEIKALVDISFYPIILPEVLKLFVQVNSDKNPIQKFADRWYTGIPMDNQMSDKLMPVWFTELWIDISKSKDVMNDLLAFYKESNENTGAFSCEVYATKSNTFWLSPAYNQDVIRIDVFWFGKNKGGDPTAFYTKFWDRLAKFNFRPHWGKYLPVGPMNEPIGSQNEWVGYLKDRYPKWDDWMLLRNKLDPKQIFLNDYWREHLGIK